jgi:protease-4
MFSRRHPYLFFLLVFSSITAVTIIGLSTLFLVAARDSEYLRLGKGGAEKVGVIELTGVISDAKETIAQLKRFREEKTIKAIVIRIDSPGGAVGPSQEIFREIRKTVKIKKVVASMGAVAASGGYYVAAGTDSIVASPGSITGSIGVIMGFTNFRQLLQKIGLVPIIVKSGKYKDIGSPVREMTDDEKKLFKSFVDKIHRQFVEAIMDGRNMDQARVESLADGRIFSGEEAKSLGLVDRLGNLEDAIEWAGRMGGIKGKITAVYGRKQKFSILKYLTEMTLQSITNRTANPYFHVDYLYLPSG